MLHEGGPLAECEHVFFHQSGGSFAQCLFVGELEQTLIHARHLHAVVERISACLLRQFVLHQCQHVFGALNAGIVVGVHILTEHGGFALCFGFFCHFRFLGEAGGKRNYHGASGVHHATHGFVEVNFAGFALRRV